MLVQYLIAYGEKFIEFLIARRAYSIVEEMTSMIYLYLIEVKENHLRSRTEIELDLYSTKLNRLRRKEKEVETLCYNTLSPTAEIGKG